MEVIKQKAYYQNIQYKGSNAYNIVKSRFNKLLQKSKLEEIIIMTNVFNKSDNKTFATFENNLDYELKNIKSKDGKIVAIEQYRDYVADIIVQCDDIIENTKLKPIDIMHICGIHYTLDRYLGLMYEYILKANLEAKGFTVVADRLLDVDFKIDLLITHPQSHRALAIQCKSFTYANVPYEIKINHIVKMNKFKSYGMDRLPSIKNVDTVEVAYMLHCDEGFKAINDNAIVPIDTIIKDNITFDLQIKGFGIPIGIKPIENIIDEISKALGL